MVISVEINIPRLEFASINEKRKNKKKKRLTKNKDTNKEELGSAK